MKTMLIAVTFMLPLCAGSAYADYVPYQQQPSYDPQQQTQSQPMPPPPDWAQNQMAQNPNLQEPVVPYDAQLMPGIDANGYARE